MMTKVAAKFLIKVKSAVLRLCAMGTPYVAYFPASDDQGLDVKKAYLRQYVGNRGMVIAEFREDGTTDGKERPALDQAKELCLREAATLVIVKLDERCRGSVLLFAPPSHVRETATAQTKPALAAFGTPRLAAVS